MCSSSWAKMNGKERIKGKRTLNKEGLIFCHKKWESLIQINIDMTVFNITSNAGDYH